MPCYSNQDELHEAAELRSATHAACELAYAIRSNQDFESLSNETRQWVKNHDFIDALRKNEESALAKRKYLRKRALEKLDQDERVALGLLGI